MPTVQPLSVLPAPKPQWLLGHSPLFAQDPLQFLCHCEQTYRGMVPLRLGLSQACLLTNPAYIEAVLREHTIFIKDTPGWRAIRTLVGIGLLTSEGAFWAKQRRLTQLVFHQQRINTYSGLMVAATEKLQHRWQAGDRRDIHQDMMHLTLDIVTRTLFNLEMVGEDAQIIERALSLSMAWFSRQQKQGFSLPPWLPFPYTQRYLKAVAALDQVIDRLIQERRASGDAPEDLLSLLLQVRDEDGSQMSDRQLRDELKTLILAGHETTANTLAWTWMLLAQHPECEAKLWQELDTVLQGRSPTLLDIPNLPYTQQVLQEAMRLYPPVVVLARSATQDYALDGYQIPKNCIMLSSPWAMQRSDRYFANPLAFQPERWQDGLEKQLPKCVYFPFGDGPRICIGKSFAQMEAVLILATLAQQYQLQLVPGQTITPFPSITLRPKPGIQVQLIRRQAVST
ncbi:cytochrome P450 [Trichothermofontia sp.]